MDTQTDRVTTQGTLSGFQHFFFNLLSRIGLIDALKICINANLKTQRNYCIYSYYMHNSPKDISWLLQENYIKSSDLSLGYQNLINYFYMMWGHKRKEKIPKIHEHFNFQIEITVSQIIFSVILYLPVFFRDNSTNKVLRYSRYQFGKLTRNNDAFRKS